MGRIRSLWLFIGLVLFAVSFYDVSADVAIPSENECRPYIEKAIHELKNTDTTATDESTEEINATGEDDNASVETTTEPEAEPVDDGESIEAAAVAEDDSTKEEVEVEGDDKASVEEAGQQQDDEAADDGDSKEEEEPAAESADDDGDSKEEEKSEGEQQAVDDGDSKEDEIEQEQAEDGDSKEEEPAAAEDEQQPIAETDDDNDSKEEAEQEQAPADEDGDSKEDETEQADDGDDKESAQVEDNDDDAKSEQDNEESTENEPQAEQAESLEESDNNAAESEDDGDSKEDDEKSVEEAAPAAAEEEEGTKEDENATAEETDNEESVEEEKVRSKRSVDDEAAPEDETANDSTEGDDDDSDNKSEEEEAATAGGDDEEADTDTKEEESQEEQANEDDDGDSKEDATDDEANKEEDGSEEEQEEEEEQSPDEEDLTLEFEIPKNLRPRGHISDLLGLDAESSIRENALKRTGDVVLKELKRVYDNAVKPLETMYKYRDLSNRHYGDPEIFSKPLIVFMGPYSGGKSTILNYLTDNEYTPNSIRSGAEPSPAYFNILMHGDEPEVLDGTQLAADWTFSGLQKFGQGLNDRLRGQKLPSKLLERVNIVEIPGILEVRKQVSRYFPFNDACQWFIDRADIIFLVYDPSKLDVGPETEAILDQLKGREYQTRILLNKGDQVKPEELLRVQGALIWNISPLMSSAQPPVMYTVSLWSHPFEQGAPVRLLQAQERAFLTDLREAIDKRIENKIASARRFAVRIRNHAKMVDCYLTTYYNQKSLFSNKKQVADKIIEHPQNYNIYEGLSTLTNISRYDLPDPEVYLDFFRLNPLYEFKKLSETCTYFKGCPINKLDIAIAYDLPELVGKYKKLLEENYSALRKEFDENCNQSEPEPPVKIR